MEDLANWIRPIISGLAGGIVVWLLISMTKGSGEVKEGVKVLSYSTPFKIFCGLLIPFSMFVVYAMSQSYKGQEIPAFLVAFGFIAGAIFFPYQAFLTNFAYDEEFIYYKSPLVGRKKEPWENLIDVGYSWLLQSDYIVVDGIGKIWCSNMLNGYAELGEFLEEKIQDLYPDES
ncbi:hypothetical protein E4634_20870 [Mangrovimicrobium sediminis]|uniref:Uncharacterized protein n=1 Tax=Mangrovimicrobium sediminis TaxID=2562682 RepID=A0A4Z0LTG9_9GAMM|nr:hypothetical protein [Haliea sp. SAOS-164]TGD70683.1 hypothetical protein E4634_20870 [Haliea sp. SAOS-164]